MTEDDKGTFTQALTGLAMALDREIETPMLLAYWSAIKHLSLDEFESTCVRCLQRMRFFPKPVEFLEMAGGKTPDGQAMDAWPAVLAALRSSSYPADPAAAEAVRNMGGPKQLGASDEEWLAVWGRKQFEEIYKNILAGAPAKGLPAHPDAKKLTGGAAEMIGALSERMGME